MASDKFKDIEMSSEDLAEAIGVWLRRKGYSGKHETEWYATPPSKEDPCGDISAKVRVFL